EYDLAKNIYLLAQAERPTLGIISGLPLQFGVGGAMAFLQGQSQGYLLYSQLGQFFNLEPLVGDFSAIPRTVDVLLVLHPPELTDRQLFAIDQYVLSGNPALVFVDPFAEVAPLSNQSNAMGVGEVIHPSSDLKPLLEAWGVSYSPELAVIDLELAQRVEVALEAGASLQDYVHWLGVDKDRLNQNDPVTAFLTVVNFASAGALFSLEKDGLEFEPLISTSENAALIDASLVRENFSASVLIDAITETETYTLAARISGQAKSAYPDGVEGLSGLQEGQINVVVTADADIFEDRFWAAVRQETTGQNVLVPIADNAAFIVNAIDHLGGSEGLVSLRARGVSKRPLEKFRDLRREAIRIEEAEKDILRRRLVEAQTRLSDLETSAEGGQNLSQSREVALRDFRNEIRIIEQNLNLAQRNLRLKIRGLENRVIFLNMFVVPVGLIFLTLLRFGVLRRGRQKP
ncbi:MAG: Gldg family protein, partial [Alphaproteobacteria bacterium]